MDDQSNTCGHISVFMYASVLIKTMRNTYYISVKKIDVQYISTQSKFM